MCDQKSKHINPWGNSGFLSAAAWGSPVLLAAVQLPSVPGQAQIQPAESPKPNQLDHVRFPSWFRVPMAHTGKTRERHGKNCIKNLNTNPRIWVCLKSWKPITVFGQRSKRADIATPWAGRQMRAQRSKKSGHHDPSWNTNVKNWEHRNPKRADIAKKSRKGRTSVPQPGDKCKDVKARRSRKGRTWQPKKGGHA